MSSKVEYLVSACLCGIPCRYDGKSALDPKAEKLVRTGRAIPFCPEALGGTSIPRQPVEIVGGEGRDVLSGKASVVSSRGEDMSLFMLRGAFASLNIARKFKIKKAWMKKRSPSCGCGRIKRGRRLVRNDGVTVALFKTQGIEVIPR